MEQQIQTIHENAQAENAGEHTLLPELEVDDALAETIKAGEGNSTTVGAWPWQLSQQRQS
jgi:hypothetical protein